MPLSVTKGWTHECTAGDRVETKSAILVRCGAEELRSKDNALGKRVLVVDAHPKAKEIRALSLGEDGVAVDTVATVDEARSRLKIDDTYGLVLLAARENPENASGTDRRREAEPGLAKPDCDLAQQRKIAAGRLFGADRRFSALRFPHQTQETRANCGVFGLGFSACLEGQTRWRRFESAANLSPPRTRKTTGILPLLMPPVALFSTFSAAIPRISRNS